MEQLIKKKKGEKKTFMPADYLLLAPTDRRGTPLYLVAIPARSRNPNEVSPICQQIRIHAESCTHYEHVLCYWFADLIAGDAEGTGTLKGLNG